MLTNSQMKANRFYFWHCSRRLVAAINEHLAAGHEVHLTTYTHSWRYTKKHLGMFKAAKNGAFVKAGKRWDCIDGCKITVFA